MARLFACVGALVATVLACVLPQQAGAGIVDVVAEAPSAPSSWIVSVATSPDGKHVYTASLFLDDGIGIYRWDEGTEKLRLVGRAGNSNTLLGASQLVVSPDGKFLYASTRYGSLRVFSRDAITGALAEIQTVPRGGYGLALSDDAAQLYVAGGDLAVFERDGVTGLLSLLQAFEHDQSGIAGLEAARGVAVSGDGQHVYVAAWGDLVTFSRDPATGLLAHVSTLNDPVLLWAAAHVLLSSDGAHLYVTSRTSDGYVSVFSRSPATGSLTHVQSHARSSASGLALSPGEDFLYVGDASSGEVGAYARDPVTGTLALVSLESIGVTYDLAMSPDGAYLFSASNGVVALARDAQSGAPTIVDVQVGSNEVRDLVTSPDLRFVYAVDREAITIFERDPVTEQLAPVGGARDGLLGFQLPRLYSTVLSPGGAHLYAGGDGALVVLARDAVSGQLSPVETHPGQPGFNLTVSSDGKSVYATDAEQIAAFARNTASGSLSLVETESFVARGLSEPRIPALSPDGLYLYVPAEPDALAVYARDPATGALDFVQTYFGDQAGFEHLHDLRSVVVTPDGKQLIYTSRGEQAIGVLARDLTTGSLTPLDVERLDAGGVFAGDYLFEAGVSPDGSLVFVSGQFLSIFRRHASGEISFIRSVYEPNTWLDVRPDGAVYTFGLNLPTLLGVVYECAEQPVSSCKQSAKSKLSLRDRATDDKDNVVWTWTNGDPTALEEISPAEDNHFALCFYDESGVHPSLIHQALAPVDQFCTGPGQSNRKSCWSQTSTVKYVDPYLSPDGLQSIQLRPSVVPKTRLKVKGRGGALDLPAPPLGLPLRVQLQSRNGTCWESAFLSARKNEPGRFKAAAAP